MLSEIREHHGDAFILQHRNPVARDYVMVSRVVLIGYPQLSDGAKVTYWVIYSHDWYETGRGGRKGYAYPTIGRLAELRHTTGRTIQRHLTELIDAQLLTRIYRKGKPSVLYIEEPTQEESEQVHKQPEERGDISVGGGVTFLSPHKEDKEKQRKKSINGVKKDLMEEGGEIVTGGWKPIKALLRPNRNRRGNSDQLNWLADQILSQTGDEHSLGCYRLIAKRCSQELVFEALSLLKEARRDRTVRQSRGAVFVGIVRRLCRDRGLPDPLGRRDSAHRGLAPPFE